LGGVNSLPKPFNWERLIVDSMTFFHLSHKEILEMSFLEMMRIIEEHNSEVEEENERYEKSKNGKPKGHGIMAMQGTPGYDINVK